MKNSWNNASGLEGLVDAVPDHAAGSNDWIANYTNKFNYDISQNEYDQMYNTMYSQQNNPSQTSNGWVNTAVKGALQLAPSILNYAAATKNAQNKTAYNGQQNTGGVPQYQAPAGNNNTALYVIMGVVVLGTIITVVAVSRK